MTFQKQYMFNPFVIEQATSQQIAETYTNLQNELHEQPSQPFEIAKNIEIYANMNYLIGEMIARLAEQCGLKKNEISITENKQIYMQRKQWEETNTSKAPAMSYFEAMAKEYVKQDLTELAKMDAQLFRFKKAYESTTEIINALKKKMEAMKYGLE